MGKLADIVIPTEDVVFEDGQVLTLRGLSSRDIEIALGRHMPLLSRLFDQWFADRKKALPTDMEIVEIVVKEAPEIIPTLIALGSDVDASEPADFEADLKLTSRFPIAVQYECVVAIIGLTVTSVSALKKILHKITTGLNATADLMSETGTFTTPAGNSKGMSPPALPKGTRKRKRIHSGA